MQEILDGQQEMQSKMLILIDELEDFVANNPNRYGDAIKPVLAKVAGEAAILSAEIAQTLALIESESEQ